MKNIDTELSRQRAVYVAKLTPFAQGVIGEDGYLQEALRELDPTQRTVMIRIFAEYAGIRKFGFVAKELMFPRDHIFGSLEEDLKKRVTPVITGYSRRLRKVGVQDPAEYLKTSFLDSVGDQILIAAERDFSFDRP